MTPEMKDEIWNSKHRGYYDKQGNQISLQEWGELIADPSYKIIEATQIDCFRVSTIWLGMEHYIFAPKFGDKSFFSPPIPIHIFETMIFCDDKNHPLSYRIHRCGTLQQAKIQHKRLYKALRFYERIKKK
jgi:hypothetical protein